MFDLGSIESSKRELEAARQNIERIKAEWDRLNEQARDVLEKGYTSEDPGEVRNAMTQARSIHERLQQIDEMATDVEIANDAAYEKFDSAFQAIDMAASDFRDATNEMVTEITSDADPESVGFAADEFEQWLEDHAAGGEKRVKRRRTERKDSADDLEADVADLKREYDRAVSELADASRAREEAEVVLADAKQKEREAQQAHLDVAQALREKESELEGARSRGKSEPVTDSAKTLYDIYG